MSLLQAAETLQHKQQDHKPALKVPLLTTFPLICTDAATVQQPLICWGLRVAYAMIYRGSQGQHCSCAQPGFTRSWSIYPPRLHLWHSSQKGHSASCGAVAISQETTGTSFLRTLMNRSHLLTLRIPVQGTHKTKTRSEVSGGGRKPRPQKGQGKARIGTIRAGQVDSGQTSLPCQKYQNLLLVMHGRSGACAACSIASLCLFVYFHSHDHCPASCCSLNVLCTDERRGCHTWPRSEIT